MIWRSFGATVEARASGSHKLSSSRYWYSRAIVISTTIFCQSNIIGIMHSVLRHSKYYNLSTKARARSDIYTRARSIVSSNKKPWYIDYLLSDACISWNLCARNVSRMSYRISLVHFWTVHPFWTVPIHHQFDSRRVRYPWSCQLHSRIYRPFANGHGYGTDRFGVERRYERFN